MTPLIHLMLLLLAWVICQPLSQKAAIPVLTVLGIISVMIFAPVAALFILLMVAEAALMVILFTRFDRGSGWRKWGAYLILFNLLFVDFNEPILGLPVATLAISFSTIRIFMTAKQLLSSRKQLHQLDLVWILAAAFYLPAIVIGPVFSGTDLKKQYRSNKPPTPVLRDARMVLQGLVLALLVAAAFNQSFIERIIHYYRIEPLHDSVIAPLLFISLFAAFWGQSLIAEHSSRFFGIRLPVNFDHPWKARSIKDFWQRWHRSMAQFVLQYIFLPLNLRGVPPRLATVIAFTFMGAWHNLSLGYLIWGMMHGILLAYAPSEPEGGGWKTLVNRVILWFVVIFLSWFANYGPWS
ncbi:MAG: MBOAT family O-acyltransferase [Neptuniibacter sp.]